MRRALMLAVFSVFLLSGAAFAGQLFFDDFATENGGSGATNYTGFTNWSVTNGAVDVQGSGFFDFYPGNNLYVDLDGSDLNQPPGRIETLASFALTPGWYMLEFSLGGSSETLNPGGINSMTVSLGGLYSEVFTRPNVTPPATFEQVARNIFVPASTSARIAFEGGGTSSDYFGLLVDNVALSDVPEPASVVLMFTGSILLISLERRRRKHARR